MYLWNLKTTVLVKEDWVVSNDVQLENYYINYKIFSLY